MYAEISSETFSILNISVSQKIETSLSAGTWKKKLYRLAHKLLQTLASSYTTSLHLQMSPSVSKGIIAYNRRPRNRKKCKSAT